MAFFRQWLLIFCALVLSGGTLLAAAGTKEQRAYAAAVAPFQDELWSRAETNLVQFIQKYPDSTNVPAAVLLLARSEFNQGKFTDAIHLLELRQDTAGNLADQYAYWVGEAQSAAGDFSEAAETFAALSRTFSQSPLRLTAEIESAAAAAKIPDWPRVEKLLEDTNGVFHRTEQLDSTNELISRGRLLLAQAKYELKNYAGALAVLNSLMSQPLPPQLDWQRVQLFCQIKILAGDKESALAATTNLLQIARLETNDAQLAESVTLRAELLEQLNQPDEAMAVYQLNLTNTAPVESQQQAILKMAELAIAQKQFSFAETNLENFLAQFTNSPVADVAFLTVGELHLKDYLASPTTNQLAETQKRFDQFLEIYTNSPLTGKAFLDRGWCEWLNGEFPESFADFKNAAQKLSLSPDLAVARFKMGDALFAMQDFSGARTNYQAVLDDFSKLPDVKKELGERALYQIIRANLELKDYAGAIVALAQILKGPALDDFAESSALLLGESTIDPVQARAVFQNLEKQFPESDLRPQVDLAIARTYEQEQNWPTVIADYQDWLKSFPTNDLLPQVEYALAQANYHAGNETNALNLFTRFVARNATNSVLAPPAQWWVADYFFRQGGTNFLNAEASYEMIFQNTNWQDSPLIYPAQLMAGRAAMARLGYNDAIRYFTGLLADTNCPPDLAVQAHFACGSALMQMPSTDTNNPAANFIQATNIFSQIIQAYPTNEFAARAWGEIGDCALQMGDYVSATNAYAQVFSTNSSAGISLRSQAQIGFGLALEKLAAQSSGTNQTNLLALARDTYLDVFYGTNLRKNETVQDSFWTKKAGLQALSLIESLGTASPEKFFDHLEELFPQAKDSLEKKRAALLPAKN